MATKLTDKGVANAKPGLHRDTLATGLILKVTSAGRKIWLMQSVWPGQATQSRRTMGKYPGMSLDDARKVARRWYEAAKVGTDPKQVEADRRHAARLAQAHSFERVAEAYIATKHGRTADKDAATIRLHLVKPWSGRAVASITPRDVRDLIGDLAKRAPYAASHVWSHAKQLFRFAVHEEMIEVSPTASLDKRLTLNGAKLAPRTRTLSDAELRKLWAVAGDLGTPEGDYYRLLMLTGCRLREAAQAQWPEFDLDGALWTVPEDRTGNKSEQVRLVPLSKGAVALLEGMADESERTGFVFSNDGGDTAINGFSKLKNHVDAAMGDDVPAWVNHDIRRTVRTRLAALGIDKDIAKRALGQDISDPIDRVYNQHLYQSEMRAALDAWGAKLAGIVKG